MRQFLLVLVALGVCSGRAQFFAGAQANLPGTLFLPTVGGHVGWESDQQAGGFGLRLSAVSILVISRVSLDVYARFALDSTNSAYLGGGVAFYNYGIPAAGGSGGSFVAPHGLVGYQWRWSPQAHQFIELSPGYSLFGSKQAFWLWLTFGINFYLN